MAVPSPLRIPLIGAVAALALVGALWATRRISAPVGQSAVEAAPAAQPCRPSAFAAFEQTSEGDETHRVVPADQNPLAAGVEVDVTTSSGSASSSTVVTLHEARGEGRVEAGFETPFDRMVTRHPVPEELRGAARESWRRAVEEAAFDTICPQADPSLARLLGETEQLRWIPGEPTMPESYALFVDPPAPGEPYWIEYLGANHRRLTTDTFGDRLERIERRGKLELLRSGHGAVVRDLERNAYAWVYVFPGGRKLRWPSVVGGTLEDGAVVLKIDQPAIGEAAESVRIDLATGAIRPGS